MPSCKRCHAAILFGKDDAGKWIPLNPVPPVAYLVTGSVNAEGWVRVRRSSRGVEIPFVSGATALDNLNGGVRILPIDIRLGHTCPAGTPISKEIASPTVAAPKGVDQ